MTAMTDDGFFNEEIADFYDRDHGGSNDESISTAVDVLAELAAADRVLEFAIGTGRIALPLAKRGIQVHGIEISEPMVAKLREKAGGADLYVAIGDMSTTRVSGEFSLVFLVFNTITNLTSQESQIACFNNAAAHLHVGGHFVIETFVPPLQRLPVGEVLLAFDRSERHWGTDEIDTATQRCVSHHMWIDGSLVRRFSLPYRYVWPSELDLMARLAGMQLVHRWSSWRREPFTAASESHVSVWMKQ